MRMRALLLGVLVALALGVACVSGVPQWRGQYPHPPPNPAGGLPLGTWRVPRSATVGGIDYDCAGILNVYWTGTYRALVNDPDQAIRDKHKNGMLGVAIASVNGGPLQKFWARSGYEPKPNTAPAGGPPPPAVAPGAPPVPDNGWQWVNPGRDTARAVTREFTAARRCFGTAAGDWQAAGQPKCGWIQEPDKYKPWISHDKIRRTWTNGAAQETGMPAGACALTKLVTYLVAEPTNIGPLTIHCAAELTPSGWSSGQSLTAPGVGIDYTAGQIVSSCVTCQNVIPMMLPGGHCPLQALDGSDLPAARITNGRTKGTDGQPINCPATLLAGDSCLVTCNDGYEPDPAVAATSCSLRGVLTRQSCRSKCKLADTPPTHSATSGNSCAVGMRLDPGKDCVWKGAPGYQDVKVSCNATGVLTAEPRECPSKCVIKLAHRAEPDTSPAKCPETGKSIALNSMCQYKCAAGFEPYSGSPTAKVSCNAQGVLSWETCSPACRLANSPPTNAATSGNSCVVGMRLKAGDKCVWKGALGHNDVTVSCSATSVLTEPRVCPSKCVLNLSNRAAAAADNTPIANRCPENGQSIPVSSSCDYQCALDSRTNFGNIAAKVTCNAKGELQWEKCIKQPAFLATEERSNESLSPPFAALSSRIRARAGQSQAALQPLAAESA